MTSARLVAKLLLFLKGRIKNEIIQMSLQVDWNDRWWNIPDDQRYRCLKCWIAFFYCMYDRLSCQHLLMKWMSHVPSHWYSSRLVAGVSVSCDVTMRNGCFSKCNWATAVTVCFTEASSDRLAYFTVEQIHQLLELNTTCRCISFTPTPLSLSLCLNLAVTTDFIMLWLYSY